MSVYQEVGSTFTHQKVEYDLNTLFRLTANRTITQLSVKELSWLMAYGEPDPKRVEAADTSVPGIVLLEKGVYYILDGFHRFTKAYREGAKTFPCRLVTPTELRSAKLAKQPHRTGPVPDMNHFQSDDIKSLRLKHQMLVTESFNLSANVSSIRSKLSAVAKTLSSYVEEKVRPQSAMSLVNYSVALKDLQKVRYTDIGQTKLVVPRGLKTPMHEYVNSLEDTVIFAEHLVSDVLSPFNTWLALRLAAPESLGDAATVTDLKRFKEHNIEGFKAQLGKFIDPISRVDKLPLNSIYPNLGDLQPTWNDLNTLISRYVNTNPSKVVKLVQDVSAKVNRLITVIDESGPELKLSQQTINILSSLCWKMAEEVEFYGIVGTLLREASTCGNYQAQEIKIAIKVAAKANAANKVVVESLLQPAEPGFELRGKWFTETEIRYHSGLGPVQDVAIDALAWALEYTQTPARNEGFSANDFVIAIEWDDKLYPLIGTDLVATVKQSGDTRISCAIIRQADLFPEGTL